MQQSFVSKTAPVASGMFSKPGVNTNGWRVMSDIRQAVWQQSMVQLEAVLTEVAAPARQIREHWVAGAGGPARL